MTTVITNNILEQLNTLILVVNQLGQVEFVSPSAKRLLGYEPQTLLGEGWWDLTRINREQRFINKSEVINLFNFQKEFKPLSFERALTASDGSEKWILWNISINENKTLIGIGHDITKQKLFEKKLAEKNLELENAYKDSKLVNKDITDSIIYAKRIQSAIMPEEDGLKKYFPNNFIHFKPKDIVSGDLYWYHKKGNKIFLSAIDCTGHGVPGAIMSVIANSIIRDTIIKRGVEDPGDILHSIDDELLSVLSKENDHAVTSDGMDIALAVFDFDTNTLAFAGAYRPLILLRDNEIIEFKGSRYPIGFYESGNKKFDSIKIPFKKDDRFYLFTDGYIDQFGGEFNKKLNRKRFYDLLLNSNDMEMEEQKSFLDYALNNWKQDELQTDDILVIGIKT